MFEFLLSLPENTAAFCLEHFDNFTWDFIITRSVFVHRILYCKPDVTAKFFLVFHNSVLFLFFSTKSQFKRERWNSNAWLIASKRPSRSILLILLLFFVTRSLLFLAIPSEFDNYMTTFKLNKTNLYVNIVNILSFR